MRTAAFILFVLIAVCSSSNAWSQLDDSRPKWTTSRIKGSPEPPLPFVTKQIFENVKLHHPTEMILVPGTNRWMVTEQDGKVSSFLKSGDPDQTLAINLHRESAQITRVLGIAFHPEFPKKPWCFVTYLNELKKSDGVKLSRFLVTDTARPVLDPSSEAIMLRWSSTDHHGGNLQFGPEGYLYLSIGDGQFPNPPDPDETGQRIDDLQSSILRIDANTVDDSVLYRIPPDNPFVGLPNARGEIWAFGVRNPWKMCFHPITHELWTGDVGWEMREMIYRIERGANYGWSVMEGSQVVKPDGKRHSIPITPPIFEHDHVDARSITGGFFWQNENYPELKDAYIYGDWMTGKIWGLKYEANQVTWQRELADTNMQIISFALDDNGEVLVVGYDGTIHRLIQNPMTQIELERNEQFPTRLSETGIFQSTVDQIPSPGVIPYSIIAHHWADHTFSTQWIGIPGDAKLKIHPKSDWTIGMIEGDVGFPHDTVFAKTVYFQSDPNDTRTQRKLETQVLHRNNDDWNAYNYIWNEEQTDAILQADVAIEQTLEFKDASQPTGVRKQVWLHASRDQCMLCHIWSAGTIHGFKPDQLNRTNIGKNENQIEKFNRLGLFESPIQNDFPAVSPDDRSASLELRARQYLHLNCAHCHRPGGGGTASFVLSKNVPTDELNLIDRPSMQGDFGILDSKVISSGDPSRSALLYRMLKSGRGHMPQFGTSVVDDEGVALIRDWIVSLGDESDKPSTSIKIQNLVQAFESDHDAIALIDELFASTSSSIQLTLAINDDQIPEALIHTIADRAALHPNMEIRDLLERFLPDDKRRKRLGNAINTELLLATTGDAEQGRRLYLESDLNCKQCHQVGGKGTNVGPDLSDIGTKRKPAEILESILNPSALIDEMYRGQIVVTVDGEILSGLVLPGDNKSIQLIDAQGKQHSIPLDEIDDQRAMTKSLMPDQLLSELTLQEAADLLSFLIEQKQK